MWYGVSLQKTAILPLCSTGLSAGHATLRNLVWSALGPDLPKHADMSLAKRTVQVRNAY
jgi:hypothetical protein